MYLSYSFTQTWNPGRVDLHGGLYPSLLRLIDIDGDGFLDLFVAGEYQDQHGPLPFTVFLGNGLGGFSLGGPDLIDGTPGAVVPRDLAIADFNGDGLPDIFVGDHGQDWGAYRASPMHCFWAVRAEVFPT